MCSIQVREITTKLSFRKVKKRKILILIKMKYNYYILLFLKGNQLYNSIQLSKYICKPFVKWERFTKINIYLRKCENMCIYSM